MTLLSLLAAQLVGLLLKAALGLLGSWFLGEGIGLLRTRRRQERQAELLSLLDETIVTAVRELEQVLVGEMKASGGGKLTADQRVELKRKSFGFVLDFFGPARLLELARFMGTQQSGAEQFVQARIERAVFDLRTGGVR